MQATEEKTQEKVFKLPKKVLKLKPVKKVRGDHGEIHLKHEANFLFGQSKNTMAPVIYKNGSYKNPLTREEQAFFEDSSKSGLSFGPGDLSVTKKTDNFWTSREATIRLDENTVTLDLSNPHDYLKYAILRSDVDRVALDPEWLEEKSPNRKLTFMYVLEPINYQENKKAKEYVNKPDVFLLD